MVSVEIPEKFVLLDERLEITWKDIQAEVSINDIDMMSQGSFVITIKVIVPKELGHLEYVPTIVPPEQQGIDK